MHKAYKVDAVIPTENISKPANEKNCARPIEAKLGRSQQSAQQAWPRGFPSAPLRPPRTLHSNPPTDRPGSAQSRLDILGGESARPPDAR